MLDRFEIRKTASGSIAVDNTTRVQLADARGAVSSNNPLESSTKRGELIHETDMLDARRALFCWFALGEKMNKPTIACGTHAMYRGSCNVCITRASDDAGNDRLIKNDYERKTAAGTRFSD